jgi:hypothetical protein
MPTVSIPPVEEARKAFRRLGYEVTGEGPALRAQRKWRTVEVRVVSATDAAETRQLLADGGRTPADTELRCFVTWRESAPSLCSRLSDSNLEYQWAVVGVDEAGNHEVLRSPSPGPNACA